MQEHYSQFEQCRLNIRLLSKFAVVRKVQGDMECARVYEALSTVSTKQYPTEVEFGKKPIKLALIPANQRRKHAFIF